MAASMLIPGLMVATSYLGGLTKRRAARQSAASEEENAISARVRGIFEERGMRLERDALLSEIRNNAAAAGIDPSSGSPLEAYLQASRETELDILHARSNASREVRAHQARATQLRRAGDDALYGAMLEGAGDALKYGYLQERDAFKPSTKPSVKQAGNMKYKLDLPKFTFGS
jgi:hypothetical protein